MYNKVIMVGNLTRDVEKRNLPSGGIIAKTAIATSYKYKSSTGEQKDEVCFLEVTIFGRYAEIATSYLKKGSKVLLEGRLIFEQWTAQDGSTRSRHSLRVDELKMLDSKPQNENHSRQNLNQPQPESNNQHQNNYYENFEYDESPSFYGD